MRLRCTPISCPSVACLHPNVDQYPRLTYTQCITGTVLLKIKHAVPTRLGEELLLAVQQQQQMSKRVFL